MGPRKRKDHRSTSVRNSPGQQQGMKISDSMMSSFEIFADNVHAPVEADQKAEERCIRSKVCVTRFLCRILFELDIHFTTGICLCVD